MYTSQEMPNLRRFLARFWLCDNQMTIILKVYIISYNLCIGEISIEKFGASFAAIGKKKNRKSFQNVHLLHFPFHIEILMIVFHHVDIVRQD